MASDRICFNISGRHFQAQRSTFKGRVSTITAKGVQETHQGRTEYFHPRHAGCFEAVLDYYQNGELHIPLNVCPAVFSRELAYWGISSDEVNACCRIRLETFNEEMEISSILSQYDEQIQFAGFGKQSLSLFIHRSVVTPYYSRIGQIYFWVSMVFVALSVFSLCAETHPIFQDSLTAEEWRHYLGDSLEQYQNDLQKLYPGEFDTISEEYLEYEEEDEEVGEDESGDAIFEEYLEYEEGDEESMVNSTATNATWFDLRNTTGNETSLPQNTHSVKPWVKCIGYACGIFFTVDIAMRFIACPSKRRFFVSFLNVVDILSLLPFYTENIANLVDPTHHYTTSIIDVLNAASAVRVFRVFRMAKQSKGLQVFLLSMKSGIREILLLLFFLGIATLVFASLAYHAERSNKFESIPDGFWWAIVTMTTVGYGDMYPITFLGKIVGSLCVVSGVLVMAVTVPIFSNKFSLYYQRTGRRLSSKYKERETVKTSNFVQPI